MRRLRPCDAGTYFLLTLGRCPDRLWLSDWIFEHLMTLDELVCRVSNEITRDHRVWLKWLELQLFFLQVLYELWPVITMPTLFFALHKRDNLLKVKSVSLILPATHRQRTSVYLLDATPYWALPLTCLLMKLARDGCGCFWAMLRLLTILPLIGHNLKLYQNRY